MNKILLEVAGLSYSHSQSGAYALFLKRNDDNNCLPIIIGEAEAQSIAVALENIENKRPLTHDLFKTFASTFDINISEVVINRFKNGIFYSELHCVKDSEEYIIDARTSDAVAIAIRFKAPIFTNHQVMEEAGIVLDDADFGSDSKLDADADSDSDADFDISELEILLQNAIEDEDYAQASKLRDIINEKKNSI